MASNPNPYLTPEQYLEIERQAEFRSEYHDGETFAMSGATETHKLIVWNCVARLDSQLRDNCRAFATDMRVCVDSARLYTYPDLTVVCGEPAFAVGRRDTLLNPQVIVEVFSPSTEAYDRGQKFRYYRALPSLKHYLLISSQAMYAELFTRASEEDWLMTTASRPEDLVKLDAISAELRLGDLYRRVDFGAVQAE